VQQTLYSLADDPNWFPEPEYALEDPPGLLAVGGDLSKERIFNAYQKGIFPWYSEGEPILWWSPDPRAVLMPTDIKINKSLAKFMRKSPYSITVNKCFNDVIRQCAAPRVDDGTWIFPEMIDAYCQLHRAGHAHSIEVWECIDGQTHLVGGLYGVLVGACFSGESMFSLKPNASKFALIELTKIISQHPAGIIDCQLANPYLMSMGAKTVSRQWFLNKLEQVSAVKNLQFVKVD
jgi:leucyl/phenylalanyl-tRNA---protein transferase